MSSAAAFHGEPPGDRSAANLRAPAAPRSSAAWGKPLVLAVAAACGLVLLARFVGEPLTAIRHVAVRSDVPLSDEQVLALSGIQGGDHWYSLSEAAVRKRLEANPLIRRAEVHRVFPDTVRITLWGRRPAALVLARAGDRSIPVLVDEEGVVYKVGSSGADLDLPVVSGISAGEMVLGAPLPQAYRRLFADLRALHDRAPLLYQSLSEIAVTGSAATASPQDLQLLVYLTSARVPILTQGSIDESLVKYAQMVLDLLSRQGVLNDIQELDFRSGDVVYRLGSERGMRR